jgi:hypothetical protein
MAEIAFAEQGAGRGDQLGQSLAYWAIVDFGQFFKNVVTVENQCFCLD